jgi:hypothetical protein
MPHSDEPAARPSRRDFLLRAIALPAAVGLGSAACSGAPQSLPAPPSPSVAPPPPPPDAADAGARNPNLAAIREFKLAEGLEPAFVFHVSMAREG